MSGDELDVRLLQDKAEEGPHVRIPAEWRLVDFLLGTRVGQYGLMLVCAVCLISTCALTWKWLGGTDDYPPTFKSCLWLSWGLFFDPGTQTGIQAENEDPRLLYTALTFSVFGFVYMLTILGMIVEVVRSTLNRWEKERSRVVCTGHVLILGWTDKTIYLLQELLHVSEHRHGARIERIQILADFDEIEMMQSVRSYIPQMYRTRWWGQQLIHCRRGLPYDPNDLRRVSVGSARDVIVLGCPGSPHKSDLEVVRAILALASLPEGITGRVLAEVRCMDTAPVLEVLLPNTRAFQPASGQDGDRSVQGILSRVTINRMLSLMACKPLVGDCLASLSSFEKGDDIYCVRVPPMLSGKTFDIAFRSFTGAICIGIKPENGPTVLAPPADFAIQGTDRLILLAPDEATIYGKEECRALAMPTSPARGAAAQQSRTSMRTRRMSYQAQDILTGQAWFDNATSEVHKPMSQPSLLKIAEQDGSGRLFVILGWSEDICDIVQSLDRYVRPHTEVHMMSDRPEQAQRAAFSLVDLENIVLKHRTGNRLSIDKLWDLPLAEAHAVLVLAEGGNHHHHHAHGPHALEGPRSVGSQATDTKETDSSDSATIACAVVICGLCSGRYGNARARQLRGRIICEVLNPQTETMLSKNSELSDHVRFFHSSAMETGLFAIAIFEPTIFSMLVALLSPTHECGKLVSEAITKYAEPEELLSATLMLPNDADQLPGDDHDPAATGGRPLCYWDLHNRVRTGSGGLLVGWHRVLDNVTTICTGIDRELAFEFSVKDRLVVLRPQKGLARAARRKSTEEEASSFERGSIPEEDNTASLAAARRAFDQHDQDRDGYITFPQLQTLLADEGVELGKLAAATPQPSPSGGQWSGSVALVSPTHPVAKVEDSQAAADTAAPPLRPESQPQGLPAESEPRAAEAAACDEPPSSSAEEVAGNGSAAGGTWRPPEVEIP